MKVVTICGSMKFAEDMKQIASNLELEKNYCVIQCVYNLPKLDAEKLEQIAKLHEKKIDISDAIYVVNINGYIGESVKREIAYAKSHDKEIIYYEELK